MTSCSRPVVRRAARAALLLMLLAAFSAHAQLQTGNIFGRVMGEDGAPLPGVTVTLVGVGAPLVTVTETQGIFRFLNLSPGAYTLRAELSGYSPVDRGSVSVNVGRNTEVAFTLKPAVSETITVTGEAPLLDTRNISTGATVTQRELDQIPTARDPWVILQQVPGVLMDRMNIGGSESGNQSTFVSKGSGSDQATYSVDGVNTTDMIALVGASSGYFDFGAFEEIQITTGGTDPRVQTPGAQVNMVTKRGTNSYSGSARYFLTPGSTQGERKIPGEAQGYLNKTNEIDDVTEWGVEAGGPIVKDRAWLWGAYGDNDINLFTAQPFGQAARYSDRSSLETMNLKLNAQLMRDNSLTLFWYDNEKVKDGRNASPTRPLETTWHQSSFGPTGTYKAEDTHLFSANFYATAMYSHVNGGFQLIPHSGFDCKDLDCVVNNTGKATAISVNSGIWRNTNLALINERPQDSYRLDGAYFFNAAGGAHELKFGFGYRTADGVGDTYWPQNQLIYDFGGVDGSPAGFGVTYFFAISPYDYQFDYKDGYLGDTMQWKNLTVQAGLRWDSQGTKPGDQRSPGNTAVPDFLPAMTYRAEDIPSFEWSSIVPRIGLTYAVGEQKKTLVRAAYNRYVGQLGGSSGYSNVVPGYKYVTFYTYDANLDDIITEEEVMFDYGIYNFSGFDLNDPSSTALTRRVDADIIQPNTNEYLLGVEHELLRDFVAGVNYTHRDFSDFVWMRPEKTRGAGDWYTSADYEIAQTARRPAGLNDVPDYAIPVYGLKDGIPPPSYYVMTNRDGYSQTYDGIELSLTKRMSQRWMLRGHLSWHDWKQQIDPEAVIDPTRTRSTSGCSNCDGAEVVQGSATGGGARGGVWISSGWSTNMAGIYQIPVIETSIGFNFNMREGYPVLYVHNINLANGEGQKQVLVNDVGANRLSNPYSLDLRAAKELRFKGVGLEVGVDVFNVTNSQTVLQRNSTLVVRGVRTAAANQIRELQNPRVVRLGVKLIF